MKTELTPASVVEAFKKTGLKPIFQEYGDAVSCGCALTALARTIDPELGDKFSSLDMVPVAKILRETLDMDRGDMSQFIDGFDTYAQLNSHPLAAPSRLSEMYILGMQCRDAVKAEFNIEEEE